MKLTYIFHSGFVLEAESAVLIFDCWRDPRRVLAGILNRQKPAYFFASHFHEDHFSSRIFSWRIQIPEAKYILSKDILRHRRAQKDDADVWMAKGSEFHDNTIKVSATGSTDIGVSWVVEIDGKTIFHAGDLNFWHAPFLQDAQLPDPPACDAAAKVLSPSLEQKRFLGELKDVKKICSHFHVAMFPVDATIGQGYTLGARQFLERFKVDSFAPMHFAASGPESTWPMEEFCSKAGARFCRIENEGQCFEI